MNDFKNIIIIVLCFLVFSLFYLILSGSFFNCAPVRCPNSCEQPLRSFLT